MRYWLCVTTEVNFEICLANGLWGVEDRYIKTLKKVSCGDKAYVHIAGAKGGKAILEIAREYFREETRVWEDKGYFNRLGVKPEFLSPSVVPDINIGNSRNTFRQSIVEISEEQFRRFEENLKR